MTEFRDTPGRVAVEQQLREPDDNRRLRLFEQPALVHRAQSCLNRSARSAAKVEGPGAVLLTSAWTHVSWRTMRLDISTVLTRLGIMKSSCPRAPTPSARRAE